MAAKLKKRAMAEFEQAERIKVKEEDPEPTVVPSTSGGNAKRIRLTLGRTTSGQAQR